MPPQRSPKFVGRIEVHLHRRLDDDDWLVEIAADVRVDAPRRPVDAAVDAAVDADDDASESPDPLVGSLTFVHLRPPRWDDDVLAVCDGYSPDFARAVTAVIDPADGRARPELLCRAHEVLYVACARIEPAYRGDDLALRATRHVLELFGQPGCLALVLPFPLMPLPLRPDDGDALLAAMHDERNRWGDDGIGRLRAYWGRLGFEPTPFDGGVYWLEPSRYLPIRKKKSRV